MGTSEVPTTFMPGPFRSYAERADTPDQRTSETQAQLWTGVRTSEPNRNHPLLPGGPMSPTAVVTGASSGIGAASARALAADGFHVVCAARRQDRIEALAEEIGGRAVVCDVTDAASVAELAASVKSVDVLLNNAGGAFDQATVEEADVEDWAQMFDVNVLGVLRVTQALLPALRADGGGLIVNLGSTAGRIAYEGGGGY